MEIRKEASNIPWRKSAVAIGKFEGLHIGHQKLIEKIVKKQQAGYMPVAFTFDISPRFYFQQEKEWLFLPEERRKMMERMGVGCLIEHPFTRSFISMSGEQFIEEILCRQLHTGYVVVGEDFCFGYQRSGNVELLKRYAKKGCFELEVIAKEKADGRTISSSCIRKAIREGNIQEANKMLGFPFFITGNVMKGNQIGHLFDIPTANIPIEQGKVLPPNGVYYTRTRIGKNEYNSITNIGVKPTIPGEEKPGAETFIYQLQEDLYGKEISIDFLKFHRPEKKFETVQKLFEQIEKDVKSGERYLSCLDICE